jgi:hypothetical protein
LPWSRRRLSWAYWLNCWLAGSYCWLARTVFWLAGSYCWLTGTVFGLAGSCCWLAGTAFGLAGPCRWLARTGGEVGALNAGLRGDGACSDGNGGAALVGVVELLTILGCLALVLQLG